MYNLKRGIPQQCIEYVYFISCILELLFYIQCISILTVFPHIWIVNLCSCVSIVISCPAYPDFDFIFSTPAI